MSARPALPRAEEIGKLVPIGRIAKDTPYSADFLRQLARSGKIRAYKLHRDWLTTPDAVRDYLKSQTKRHEKALSLLEAAEKAFLAVALLLIVFSATPQARAQGLSNPPPSTTAAILHSLIASWQQFAAFYGKEFLAVGAKTNQGLLSFGQALLGKTTEEYLAETPTEVLVLSKHSIHHTGDPVASAVADAFLNHQSQVLAAHTTKAPVAKAPAITTDYINRLIVKQLDAYSLFLGSFGFGQNVSNGGNENNGGNVTPGFSGPNGVIQNGNGQSTAVVGGQPIVTFLPAVPSQNFNGTSLAGFGTLSASTLTSGNTTISGNISVSGATTLTGSFNATGATTLATTTLSTLTVSGAATFSGSTTITGLTVTGLNPGLTLGSVAFQGASALAQDNANFFYDSTNHRLGLGTTTPNQLLNVYGNLLVATSSTPTLTVSTASQYVGVNTSTPGANLAVQGISGSTLPEFIVASSTNAPNLIVTSAGSVGIGTATPAGTIVVQGTAGSNASIFAVASSSGNTLFGVKANGAFDAGYNNANFYFGTNVGNANTTGSSNVAMGYQAMQFNTSGVSNIAFGTEALKHNTTGTENVAISYYALHNDVNGSQQIAIGDHAQETTTGNSANNCIGDYCLNQNQGGSYSDLMGLGAAQNYVDGLAGLAGVGHHILFQEQHGQDNLAFGHAAGYSNISGSQDLFIGSYTGFLAPGNSAAGNQLNLALTASSTNLGIGLYCYKIAYEFDNVEAGVSQSAGGDCITTDSGHKEVTLTGLPTYSGPLNVTARIIYRTVVNGNPQAGTMISAYKRVTRIADNTTTTFVDNVADASLGTTHVDPNGCILIGSGTDLWGDNLQDSASCWKSGQIVIGSAAASSTELYLGAGPYSTTPRDFHIRPSGIQGTNANGPALYLGGGWSTGSGTGGPVVIEVSSAGSSGTARNVQSEVARFTATGVGIGSTTPGSQLSITGVSGATAPLLTVASSSNSTYLTVTAAGNVGIGTSSPASLLGVNGNALFNGNVTLTAGNVVQITGVAGNPGSPASGMVYYDSTAQKFKVVENGTVKILCNTTDQACGTGTGSAWSGLSNPTGNLALSMSSYTTALTFGNSTANANLFTLNDSANNTGTGTMFTLSTANGSSLNPFSVTASSTNALYINSSGNLGVGTTTPSSKLSVVGDIDVSGSRLHVDTNGKVGIGSSTPTATLAVTGVAGSNDILRIASSTNSVLFNVTAAGNVGIGLAPSYTLDVAGSGLYTIHATNNSGSNNSAAIYGNSSGGGNSFAVAGTYSGNASNNGTAGWFQNTQTTGTVGYGVQGLISGTQTTSWAGSFSNTSGSGTKYGVSVSVTQAGTLNVGGYFTASGGTTNYGLIVDQGNVGIGTTTPTLGPLTMASGAYVTSGGTWTNASDRNLKENFATMTPADILQKIGQLPVTEWNYKSEGPTIKHIGPVAQDFYALFQVGNSSTSISTIDPGGVALLGIQALDQEITALQGSLTGNATTTNLSVYNPGSFSGDSVGEARILSGQNSVRITFAQAYQYQPIVTITLEGNPAAVFSSVNNVDSSGFTIQTLTPTTSDTTFAWHSFASPAERLFVSDGTSAPLPLLLPVASGPSAALAVVSSPSAASATIAVVAASSTPDATASSTADNLSSSSTPQVLGTATGTPAAASPPADSAVQPDAAQAATTTSTLATPAPAPIPLTSQAPLSLALPTQTATPAATATPSSDQLTSVGQVRLRNSSK